MCNVVMDFFECVISYILATLLLEALLSKLKFCSATEIIKNLENWNKSTLKAASSNGIGQTVQTSVLSSCVRLHSASTGGLVKSLCTSLLEKKHSNISGKTLSWQIALGNVLSNIVSLRNMNMYNC